MCGTLEPVPLTQIFADFSGLGLKSQNKPEFPYLSRDDRVRDLSIYGLSI